jgi:hypothetical protein
MPCLPASARPVIFGLSMAFLYAGLMSGIFTWKALVSDWSIPVWLRAWALAFAIAAPAGLVLRPIAEALSQILTES